jgi:hypothetical protein
LPVGRITLLSFVRSSCSASPEEANITIVEKFISRANSTPNRLRGGSDENFTFVFAEIRHHVRIPPR